MNQLRTVTHTGIFMLNRCKLFSILIAITLSSWGKGTIIWSFTGSTIDVQKVFIQVFERFQQENPEFNNLVQKAIETKDLTIHAGINICVFGANYFDRKITLSFDSLEQCKSLGKNNEVRQSYFESLVVELSNAINDETRAAPRIGDFTNKTCYANAAEAHEYRSIEYGRPARQYAIQNLSWYKSEAGCQYTAFEEYMQHVTTPMQHKDGDDHLFPGEMSHFRNYELRFVYSQYEIYLKVLNNFISSYYASSSAREKINTSKILNDGMQQFQIFCSKNEQDLNALKLLPELSLLDWQSVIMTFTDKIKTIDLDSKKYLINESSCCIL